MADNSDIAFQIYSTIQQLQMQEIKNGTIKSADLLDVSEKDFIRNLQADVFKLVGKNVAENLIDDVYRNILKRTINIADIREILVGDQIKLPESLIREAVKNVVTTRESVTSITGDIPAELNNTINEEHSAKAIFNDDFLKNHTVAESMEEYEALSASEKGEYRRNLSNEAYGSKDVNAFAQVAGTQIEEDEFFNMATEAEQQSAREIIDEIKEAFTNFLKSVGAENYKIAENFGKDFVELSALLTRIKCFANSESPKEIAQLLKQKDAETLKKLGISNVDRLVQRIVDSCKGEEKFEEFDKIYNIANTNKQRIENGSNRINKFLEEQLGKEIVNQISYDDIRDIFLPIIHPNTGEIDPILASIVMKNYAKEYNFTFDEKSFFDSIRKQKNILIEDNTMTMANSTMDTKDNELPKQEGRNTGDFINDTVTVADEGPNLDNDPIFQAMFAAQQEVMAQFALIYNQQTNDNSKQQIQDDDVSQMMSDKGEEINVSAIIGEKQKTTETGNGVLGDTVVINSMPIALGSVVLAARNLAENPEMTSDNLKELIPLELVKAGRGEQILNDIGLEEPDQDI